MSKTGGKINIFLYILRRILRLYPSVLLVLAGIFFLPWISSGPFWPEMAGLEVKNCHQSWWANLLFINNWRPAKEMCMQHSWYISADMQLHIIAVFVLIALYRCGRWVIQLFDLTVISTTCCCLRYGIFSCVWRFFGSWNNNIRQ
ncbi:Nose resistant to fluoxetine protein 6 like protein [Argiope bruennichi]|uniref:Nose resistant to fluoxetine protein 6 like protein n=1 Tax=Argiope bruennichi TaxID=94029 RepID=A0A8T0EQ86_ARGBR|nr:Nose resistant to fluoxetine protein 6 like protein [Argiope bruennichi]